MGLKHIIIKIAFDKIQGLINKSLKDDLAKDVADVILVFFMGIVRVLTDDDKDNSSQVKKYLRENLPELASRLFAIGKMLVENDSKGEVEG
jgi:hypothetical protein